MSKQHNPLKLWYKEPADQWIQGIPVGNGRLGAMLYGGPTEEILALNEDTLWSGYPKQDFVPEGSRYIEPIRKLLFEGQIKEAQRLVETHMLGFWQQSYLPLALVKVKFLSEAPVSDYSRELDLRSAVASSAFMTENGGRVVRKCFASTPDNVIVYHFESTEANGLHAELELTSLLRHEVMSVNGSLRLKGESPSHVDPHYVSSDEPVLYAEQQELGGMAFGVMLQVTTDCGEVLSDNGLIRISGANTATVVIAASTGYRGYAIQPSRNAEDCLFESSKTVEMAASKSIGDLLRNHADDYRGLFDRVSLELDGIAPNEHPINERLAAVRSGLPDPGLSLLLYQFGRYLLISCSRPGTQPANLQGLWNDRVRPYWSSSWTANINVQMNYWLAEGANLPDCHLPLLELIEDMSDTGKKVAFDYYGCNGWTAHHNIDIWRTASPAAGFGENWACCSFWPLGGVWLSQHLWEHYAYGQDVRYLKDRAYPVMREAALFCLDWLTEDKEGHLVTAPSTSPENSYLNSEGKRTTVSIASTSDMSMIWELFSNCIEASRLLGSDEKLRDQLLEARSRLFPLRIGRYGQLQEWFDDPEDFEIQHRHFSHLFALHPGTRIRPELEPELADAVRSSIHRRVTGGAEQIGWSLAWLVNLYARLGMAEEANRAIYRFMSTSAFDSLLCFHAPLSEQEEAVFQIDGNFGIAAAVNEMLVQSHHGTIILLPALPAEWSDGRVSGLRVRGGAEIDMCWLQGKLQEVTVRAEAGGIVQLRYRDSQIELQVERDRIYKLHAADFAI